MTHDPFVPLKDAQRAMWRTFTPMATFTTPPAAALVRFAGICAGEKVLDVGAGTGVVAITAAVAGADVDALDLTPALVEEGRRNAVLSGTSVRFVEGDAEALPYPDATFDVVVSQFGHMFAPRADVAIAEMRRVLRPGGRVAFSTWPPEHMTGRFFQLVGSHSPPLPEGVTPPWKWGDPTFVTERLAHGFDAPFFGRGTMLFPALSVGHYRAFMEGSIGPFQKLAERLASEPERLAKVRAEFDALATPHHRDNAIHMDFLMSRATAR